MLKTYKTELFLNFSTLYAVILGIALITSCKKKEDLPVEEVFPKYSYEVNCNYCDITYTDASNNAKTLKSNIGNWSYQFPTKVGFELKLNVKTTLSAYQSISAYILKDEEVVYGNLGYNSASVSYHAINGNGNSSFGQYTGSGSSGGNSGSGSSTPTSSVCGARNKSGGYCKRVVAGGGRCWQHK